MSTYWLFVKHVCRLFYGPCHLALDMLLQKWCFKAIWVPLWRTDFKNCLEARRCRRLVSVPSTKQSCFTLWMQVLNPLGKKGGEQGGCFLFVCTSSVYSSEEEDGGYIEINKMKIQSARARQEFYLCMATLFIWYTVGRDRDAGGCLESQGPPLPHLWVTCTADTPTLVRKAEWISSDAKG